MQFYTNSNTNRQSIVHDVLYLCGLQTVSASFASYSLHDITRNCNNAYIETIPLIWKSAFGWRYDDSNNTDAPVAYKSLGHLSASYTIPTAALRIEGVEIKDSAGDWHKLIQINSLDLDISKEEFMTSPGLPIYYEPIGNEIRLYPAAASGTGGVTLSSGMCVRLSRTPTLFTTNGTTASTTSPGFASPFHKILSYSAAIDFVQDKATQDRLVAMKTRLEQGLVTFYSKRNVEQKANIKPNKNINRYR